MLALTTLKQVMEEKVRGRVQEGCYVWGGVWGLLGSLMEGAPVGGGTGGRGRGVPVGGVPVGGACSRRKGQVIG